MSVTALTARMPGRSSRASAERWLARSLARPRLLLALLAVYIPLYFVYFKNDEPFSIAHARAACGQPVLDTRWSYSAAGVHSYLAACGAVGRRAIEHQQLADLVYPALYATVLTVIYALLLRAIRPQRQIWHSLIWLPIGVAALDYAENVGVWSQLAAYPASARAVSVFSTITGAKQLLGTCSIAIVFILAVAAGFGSWRRHADDRRTS